MRNRVTVVGAIATALVAGGAVTWAQQSGQQQRAVVRTTTRESAGAQPEVAPLPPGAKMAEVVPRGEMERALVAAADAATRSGGWGDMVRTLVAEDRKSLGTTLHESYADLNGRADAFRESWGKRYGQSAGFAAAAAGAGRGSETYGRGPGR